MKIHPTHSMAPIGKNPWPEKCKRCGVSNEFLDIRLVRPCPTATASDAHLVTPKAGGNGAAEAQLEYERELVAA